MVGAKTAQITKHFVFKSGGYENIGFVAKDLYNKIDTEKKKLIAIGDAECATYTGSKTDEPLQHTKEPPFRFNMDQFISNMEIGNYYCSNNGFNLSFQNGQVWTYEVLQLLLYKLQNVENYMFPRMWRWRSNNRHVRRGVSTVQHFRVAINDLTKTQVPCIWYEDLLRQCKGLRQKVAEKSAEDMRLNDMEIFSIQRLLMFLPKRHQRRVQSKNQIRNPPVQKDKKKSIGQQRRSGHLQKKYEDNDNYRRLKSGHLIEKNEPDREADILLIV
ncbi:hypothetical protein ACH5RR_001307 [Cinchona calisaya]|uniref:Uncharacterized protein n=1 Tax=Cinchona calisaya TaxID=153742 RepID=A0ABD3B3H2_9GENT